MYIYTHTHIYSNQEQRLDIHRNKYRQTILPLQPILLLFILTATDISNCFLASSPLPDSMRITENENLLVALSFSAGSSSVCDIHFDTKPKLGLWK